MVPDHRPLRADSGQNCFGPAGIAGIVVILDVPRGDDQIGGGHSLVYLHRSSPTGLTQMDASPGIMLHMRQLDRALQEPPHLIIGHPAMRSQAKDNLEVGYI